ncbi:unnamed protein product [Chrysoparadoxa australica]
MQGPAQCDAGAVPGVIPWDNKQLVQQAHSLRESLPAPHQSNFRVVALLVYQDKEKGWQIVSGTNSEPAFIGGSICAERAAMCKLREQVKDFSDVSKVVVVSDAPGAISPGTLCREFLATHLDESVGVVMGGSVSKDPTVSAVGALYPHPCIYGAKPRSEQVRFGFVFSQEAQKLEEAGEIIPGYGAAILEAYDLAQQATGKDKLDSIHPVRYAAAAVFEDGSIEVTHQLKAIEYGSTLDPVVQLLPTLEKKREDGVKPVGLLQVDQFGNCHAPFAMARALLTEHGYGDLISVIHSSQRGVAVAKMSTLVPAAGTSYLSAEDISYS